MAIAYIGLGSNLGNRLAFLRGGRDALLSRPEIQMIDSSGVYQTEPVGGPEDNPLFLNAVLAIATSLNPRQLLTACLAVEDEFGRTRPERWAPRTLDVDILLYGDQVVVEPDLTIPHPRIPERAFVLAPLREVAPDVEHPQLHQTVRELAAALPEAIQLERFRDTW